MSFATNPPVLIAGSGPTGLVLALTLLKNDIPVRIIEKNTEFHRGIRGTTMQPRTLELFKFLGIIDEVLAVSTPPLLMAIHGPDGQIAKAVTWAEEAERCAQIPFPEPASTSQAEIENILRVHVAKFGVNVEVGVALIGIEQNDATVTAHLAHEGVEELFNCQYVVGADGAKGNTRKLLELPFIGQSIPGDRMLTANVKVDFNREYWHMWGSFSDAAIALKPIEPAPLYQLQALGPNLPEVLPLDLAGVQDLFNKISGGSDIKFEKVECATEWRANIRMTKSFNVGRVFLAGDSAHCHSPSGGQGTNTAVQDAVNLGWKLSLVLRKLAPCSLLDSYAVERMPVVAEMLNLSTDLHSHTFPRIESSSLGQEKPENPENVMFRPKWFLQLGVNYRWSTIILDDREVRDQSSATKAAEINPYGKDVRKVHAGDRAPDATHLTDGPTITTLFDILSVLRHTILVFPETSSAAEIQHDLAAMNDLHASNLIGLFLIVQPNTEFEKFSVMCDGVLSDTEGYAISGYNIAAGVKTFTVIRPDGVIGAYTLGVEGVRRYFSAVFL